MVSPTFLLIGVQKGGTKSAIHHFNQHQDVYMIQKELHFFDNHKKYRRGNQYYELMFQECAKKKINLKRKMIGEKTPSYVYLRYAIDRIALHYPDIKLVIMLREPISRAYSEYNMHVNRKKIPKSVGFMKSIKRIRHVKLADIKSNDYWALQRGYYVDQIEYIYSKFPRENVYIGISEEIRKNPLQEYNKIFKFLGLEPLENLKFKKGIHQGNYQKPLGPKGFKYLYQIYHPYNERLYQLLGRRIEAWENIYREKGVF